jgi:hypothetical protein
VDRLADVMALAEAAPADEAVDLLRPLLADIGWFQARLSRDGTRMAADPLHLPGYRTSGGGPIRHLILARTERIWVSAMVIDPQHVPLPSRIHFSGRRLLCRVLGHHVVRATGYRIEGERLVAAGEIILRPGTLFDRDERQETLRLHAGPKPVLLLRALIAPRGPVEARLFDAATGAPVATGQIDEGHARALMMLSLLRLQGRTDAAALFEAALDSPLPAQRWATMREYLALDARAALPALDRMAQIEAGQVGRLARETLARIAGAPCRA